jgi:SAM-dependent methyltransferase
MLIQYSKSEQLEHVEKAYLKVRAKEDRIYPDELVKNFPKVDRRHPQYKEWLIRQDSLLSITQFLTSKPQLKRILDLGCGNGWMSNCLQQQGYEVVGVDINTTELEQAARLFPSVTFYELDIFQDVSMLGKFDAVIISAALQYFEFPAPLLVKLKTSLLLQGGILMIADTKFYSHQEIEAARQRSKSYYKQLQSEEMAAHYFHHHEEIITQLGAHPVRKKSIFDRVIARWRGLHNPFTIYVIEDRVSS